MHYMERGYENLSCTENIYNSLFMVLGTAIIMVLLHFSAAIPRIFLFLSVSNAVVALLAWISLKRIRV